MNNSRTEQKRTTLHKDVWAVFDPTTGIDNRTPFQKAVDERMNIRQRIDVPSHPADIAEVVEDLSSRHSLTNISSDLGEKGLKARQASEIISEAVTARIKNTS